MIFSLSCTTIILGFSDTTLSRNLIEYIEQNKIKPLVSKTYLLKNIKRTQEDFIAKKFTGKLVLTPPHDSL